MTPIIIATLAALAVFIGYLAFDISIARKTQVEGLRHRILANGVSDEQELVELDQEPGAGGALLEGMLKISGMDTQQARSVAKAKLEQAGILSQDAPLYYLFYNRYLRYLFGIGGLMLALVPGNPLLNGMVGLIVATLGFFGADIYVKNQRQKREKILIRAFPDTLDLLVVCVESGLALDAALARVCNELGKAHPDITREFNQTRLELALLNDRSQALMNLAERTNLIPFRSLVAALIQTEKFGTSLTDTLRVLSEDYRLTRLMQAEEKAGKLPALMTIPLICLLLPSFFIIVLGPPFIRVIEQGGLFGDR